MCDDYVFTRLTEEEEEEKSIKILRSGWIEGREIEIEIETERTLISTLKEFCLFIDWDDG